MNNANEFKPEQNNTAVFVSQLKMKKSILCSNFEYLCRYQTPDKMTVSTTLEREI